MAKNIPFSQVFLLQFLIPSQSTVLAPRAKSSTATPSRLLRNVTSASSHRRQSDLEPITESTGLPTGTATATAGGQDSTSTAPAALGPTPVIDGEEGVKPSASAAAAAVTAAAAGQEGLNGEEDLEAREGAASEAQAASAVSADVPAAAAREAAGPSDMETESDEIAPGPVGEPLPAAADVGLYPRALSSRHPSSAVAAAAGDDDVNAGRGRVSPASGSRPPAAAGESSTGMDPEPESFTTASGDAGADQAIGTPGLGPSDTVGLGLATPPSRVTAAAEGELEGRPAGAAAGEEPSTPGLTWATPDPTAALPMASPSSSNTPGLAPPAVATASAVKKLPAFGLGGPGGAIRAQVSSKYMDVGGVLEPSPTPPPAADGNSGDAGRDGHGDFSSTE